MLAALAALAVLLGVGLAVFFGLLRDQGGGETAGEALAGGLYGEDMSESWTCDDIREILYPSGIERFPPVVAIVEAEDVGARLDVPSAYLVSLMARRAELGRPHAGEKEALREIEDRYLLYIAAVREAGQGNSGLLVSEDEARAYIKSRRTGDCGATVERLVETQMVPFAQVDLTTNRFIQQMFDSAVRSGVGVDVDQTIADLIAQARPTVKVTEVALAAAGGLECTQADAKVACPLGLPTSEPTPTPAKE
ncbi:MAG: hypothetical protein MUP14_03425 [Dehalococcoidia bacterium]|nr:hypothetical protein [Dehalococcoidia bacterium]